MIDPVVLGGVINDLAAMEAAIAAETKGLKAEFEQVGVPGTAVNELTKVAAWLHGELPMLRRRHAAAVLLAAQRMQCVPGTNLISMAEDPEAATRQAGELAAKQVRAGLDGKPPTREASVAAAAAVRQITARKGRLSAEELAFLKAFYGGLGRGVYQVPSQLGEDKSARSALADGLLMLSNAKLGGGIDKVPAEIRQDLRDTGWGYWNSRGGNAADPLRGQGFPELARFLLNRQPGSVIAPGDEFGAGLARSAVDNLRLQQWLGNEYGDSWHDASAPERMAQTPLLSTTEVQQLLPVVALNHRAVVDLMADPFAVRALVRQNWEDKGAAVAGLTDWAVKAALDPSSTDFVLAKRATADLINAVTTNGSTEDVDGADYQMFKQSLAWLKVSPEIERAFSRLMAANLADFGDGEPSNVTGPGDENHLRISTDQRHRFAILTSTDQQARVILKVAAAAYKAQILAEPTHERVEALGFIDAMITGAAHSAVYYENMEVADDKNKALAAAQADDAMVKSVADYVFGQLISTLPGQGAIVGAGKWVLNRIVSEGVIKTPAAPQPVLPVGVDTDADATGFKVAEVQAAHDFAAARLRADPSPPDMPAEVITRGADGREHLKEISQMSDIQRRALQVWVGQIGGSDYVEAYASTFRDYYVLRMGLLKQGGFDEFVTESTR